ncbi:MAG: hypothetical protein JO078_11855 [Candidatus Eremiobacteraeota bacterium]|nr:hypothetical protein [Candidatus Eremiobacteraeota bacterium]
MFSIRVWSHAAVAAAATLAVAGCSHGGAVLPTQFGASAPQSTRQTQANADYSMLKLLVRERVIGSTIVNGQQNPYGLTVAPSTNGVFTKGDLVVCNFNNSKNIQGTGSTIVGLHPTKGAKPFLVSSSVKTLRGCDALALAPDDTIWAAAFSSNDNPVLGSNGKLLVNIDGPPFAHPFGQIYAPHGGASGAPVFYATNARGEGTVVRINLGSSFTYDVIAEGFAINHGKPGSIFGPSGLAYNDRNDTLYIVDGTNNTVVAFSKVSTIPSGGIIVEKDGLHFKGPAAGQARVVYAGNPLNGPISSALLFNGNLVVGNTTNKTGRNVMVEMTPSGRILATRNVDHGTAGAIFGMVATGNNAFDAKIYFNDDNTNEVRVLER